jgi:VCBS repeat-containing protein
MANYIRSDLDFILAQIKIAEANAAGQPLYGNGTDGVAGTADDGLIPNYLLSWGLRTVDGSYNNLLPGQELWGSSNQPFVELLTPDYRPAGSVIDMNGPAPGGLTAPNYNPSNNPGSIVVDGSLRTISNLIVDQTLGNPAAILKALQTGGVAAADLTNLGLVLAIHDAFQPFADAAFQTGVAAATAHNAFLVAQAAFATDQSPANQALLDAATANDAAAAATAATAAADLVTARDARDAQLPAFGIAMDGDNVQILNVATDGVSAPFNSWFTLFGQFFDHGLDLVNKGGSGTVFVPLQPDDPLYVPGSNTNFMVLTRATTTPGADGIMGTADDVRPVNTTTPFVDQNQTYTSHPSHQVFLRQYVLNSEGKPVATGNLIEGGGAAAGGMATWGEVKAQTLLLGIQLVDQDVGKVPLLRTDAYGNFIPDAVTGMAQVVVGIGADGIPNTADDIVVSGTPGAPILLATAGGTGAIRTNSAFLADIAHTAVPNGIEDGDITIGLSNPGNNPGVYDNELLDAHFIAGDGRANENIGLTAVHSIFHSEHNRLAAHTKDVVLADAAAMLAGGSTQAEAVAFLNEWLTDDVVTVPANQAEIDGLIWDGNRIFQAAKFGTEMQYQHLVFEDFARKIQPNIDFFVVPDGYHADINPSITAEFAHVVYRFGHSMLNEQIDRFDTSFTNDQIGLIEAFLNPVAFDGGGTGVAHTIADSVAAGDIIRGMTRQVGNEIDEFVTTALRNNLLGLPLDLATINLARGRDAGVPSLNAARREFYEVSNQAPELKPYESWVDFAANLKNEASVINFMAAYGTHSSIVNATTIEGKRDAAMAIIFNQQFGSATVPADAQDFLNGTGAWASLSNGVTTTGLDVIDLWIGGLAERTMVGGGLLGATFNFVFEVQLEQLQDGDRFYYLQRLDGLHFLAEMENNTFAKVISLNSNADHLPSDVFSTPGLILEVNQARQYNDLNGDGIMEQADPTGGSILTPLVIRNNPATPGVDSNYLKYTGAEHVLLGGTNGNDIIISSEGDDTLYGDAGNDRLEGGQGNDQYIGGAGDDIIVDLFGDDIIRSGSGNDAINAGVGTDLVIADEGNDFIVLGADVLDEAFGGLGNDFITGSKTTEQSMGGEGDDWIEVGAWTGAVGDNFDDVFRADAVKGHDVFSGDGGFDEFVGEGGDDIWNGTLGRGKFDGNSGFDWATYKDFKFGVDVDLNRVPFDVSIVIPPNASIDTFTYVEGVSGSKFNDQLSGSDFTDLTDTAQGGARGSVLETEGIALIAGLQVVVGAGVTSHSTGDILLGGAGSDVITGRGGDDIIDGDKWLNVRIGVHAGIGVDGGVGAEIDSADSMSELVTEIFNGTYNPGQLRIHREILNGGVVGDIDTAVYSGNFADYTISVNPDFSLRVAHTGGTQADGTDTLRNIEQLRFADGTHAATEFLNITPVITSNGGGVAAAISLAENTSIATAVATVTATDGNNVVGNPLNPQALTYSISGGADAARFSINATTGVLSFVASPDFDLPTDAGGNNVYDVIVQVSDNLGAADTQALAVTVTNVNEAPVIISNGGLATANINIAENGTFVTNVAATDEDANTTLTYTIGGADAANFLINAATGELVFNPAPDFESLAHGNIYNVTVTASDGALSDTQALTVTVTNVNEAPVITSTTTVFNVAENTTAVTTITATDVDAGAVLAYSIAGGADADKFVINAAGVLSFITSPNFEALADVGGNNVYDVIVQVSDGTLTDTQAIAVTVTNVNEAPVITSAAAISVAENTTAVGTVTATDVDAGTTLVYSISGTDAAKFNINAATGALSFINAPNFEAPTDAGANNVYDIIVGASDGAITTTQALAVTVTNVNTPNQTLNGNNAANTLTGGEGNDTISGLGGNDTLSGRDGNDNMSGGNGNDVMYGGTGNDNLNGGDGSDTLFGENGADILSGGNGVDVLYGGAGADSLNGGAGNDLLFGDAGNDNMNGGNGNDTFYLATGGGADIITGFDAIVLGGQDRLNLAGYGITAGNFASHVSIVDLGNDTRVTIDGADTITLLGVNGVGLNAITQADFSF